MWDIGGFFTSSEFLIQVAGILSAILVAVAEGLINGLFGVS
jgi:hypothetical protein